MSKQISLFTYQVPDLGDVEDVISWFKKTPTTNQQPKPKQQTQTKKKQPVHGALDEYFSFFF